MVEHRIARLVQLGIRQARYFGRTKTLFQVCLAAAVANLTLLAATSTALSGPGGNVADSSLMLLAAMLTLSSVFFVFSAFGRAALPNRRPLHPAGALRPLFSTVQAQLPPSRPRF